MLKLKCLGSGSKQGNCYLLSTEKETLILDCGLPIMEIKKGLNFDIRRISGVLCSHVHLDHSKALNDFYKMGAHIVAPFQAGEVKRSHATMGSFDVTSFDLPHNGTWNNGFLIKAEGQKILYMTDFEYCPYIFKKQWINHMIIECNYEQELVDKDLPNFEHKVKGHCSLDTCKTFVEKNRTKDLRSVLLCHMGGETCRGDKCVTEVQKVAGNAIYVDYAAAGKEWELKKSLCPF